MFASVEEQVTSVNKNIRDSQISIASEVKLNKANAQLELESYIAK